MAIYTHSFLLSLTPHCTVSGTIESRKNTQYAVQSKHDKEKERLKTCLIVFDGQSRYMRESGHADFSSSLTGS